MSAGSVTLWIQELKKGNEAALAQIQQRYWRFLVSVARSRVKTYNLRMVDEEDVAQQAFWSFYETLNNGAFPNLDNRHDLMSLFVLITARKACNAIEHEYRQKRGGGKVRGESAVQVLASSGEIVGGMDQREGDSPLPDEEAMLNDCFVHYMENLSDNLRPFAELYLAGCTHPEIAEQMECSVRTVDRKIPLIISEWKKLAKESLGEDYEGDL